VSEPILIALDSGTSMVKALAFDATGKVVTAVSRPNLISSGNGGAVEQDMERTWEDTCAVLGELTARLNRAEVAALALTGQGDGTWLIDRENVPVAPALLWLDARAGQLVEGLRNSGAARKAFAFTGTGLAACQQPAQFLWLDRNHPELLERAVTAFHCKDWLYFKLTGERATDPSEASFSFGDYRTRNYRAEVLEAFGLTHLSRLLLPIVDGVRQWHGLSADAAARTGLTQGTPVVLGYLDLACGTLAAGSYACGAETGVSIIGTTGMHLRLVPEPDQVVPSAAMTGYCIPFPVPGYTLQMQTNMAATLNLDWLVHLVQDAACLGGAEASRDNQDILRALDDAVLKARPGTVLFHPFISCSGERGPFIDPFARAGLLGIDQNVRLPEVARAVYEGLGLAARDCYIAMGGLPASVRITGGAAHSESMRVILAACLNCPVSLVAHDEAGAAGAAMIAAVSVGLYRDMAECVTRWIAQPKSDILNPDSALARTYEVLFPVYTGRICFIADRLAPNA
jgi:erythritol kinase